MEMITLSLAAARTRTAPAFFTITDGPADADGEVIEAAATPAKVIAALGRRGIEAGHAMVAMKIAVEDSVFTIATGE